MDGAFGDPVEYRGEANGVNRGWNAVDRRARDPGRIERCGYFFSPRRSIEPERRPAGWGKAAPICRWSWSGS